jgi:hypothetical protein
MSRTLLLNEPRPLALLGSVVGRQARPRGPFCEFGRSKARNGPTIGACAKLHDRSDLCLHRGSRCVGVTLHQSLPRGRITVTTLAAIIELRRELITTPARIN